MSTVNTLTVPEVAHHHTRDGVTAYAVRLPGERLWTGHDCRDGSCIATPETYADARLAAFQARAVLDGPPRSHIGEAAVLADRLSAD